MHMMKENSSKICGGEGVGLTPYGKHTQVTDQLRETYLKKNQDYGDSFNKSLNEDGLLVAKIRLMDKMSRFSSLIKSGDILVKDESIEDTLMDMANYAIMTVMWMRDVNTTDKVDTSELRDPAWYLNASQCGADLYGDKTMEVAATVRSDSGPYLEYLEEQKSFRPGDVLTFRNKAYFTSLNELVVDAVSDDGYIRFKGDGTSWNPSHFKKVGVVVDD